VLGREVVLLQTQGQWQARNCAHGITRTYTTRSVCCSVCCSACCSAHGITRTYTFFLISHSMTLQHTATHPHCNTPTLQHTATHCNKPHTLSHITLNKSCKYVIHTYQVLGREVALLLTQRRRQHAAARKKSLTHARSLSYHTQ